MQLDPGTPLLELGKDFPKARRLFRRLNFDIEPGSPLTVSEACSRAGISLKDFMRTLAAMTPEQGTVPTLDDWARAPLADLVRYILERHHTYTRQELDRLGPLLDETAASHGERYPELARIRGHFRMLQQDLAAHLESEEQVIFPSIIEGEATGKSTAIATLEDLHRMALKEHEAAEELFQNIAILTRNFSLPPGAPPSVRSLYLGLRDLEEDLFVHIYLENHLLFPRAVQGPASADPRQG